MSEFRFDEGENSDDDDDEGSSFNWGGRNATIFLIDVSPNMVKSSDEESFFKKALKCAYTSQCRKIISSDQDLSAVVLFNTREKKNPTDFPNVYVIQELARPGAERVLQLEELQDGSNAKFEKVYGSTTSATLNDALWVCKTLFTHCTSKLMGQNILLMTCVDDPHKGDQHKQTQACKRVQDLHEADIHLELLHMGDQFNVNKFYKDLIIIDDDEDSKAAVTLSDPASRFEELLDRVRRLEHKRRSSGKVTFTLAPGVELGVGFYTSVRKTYKPSKVKLYKVTNEEVRYMKKEFLEDTGELLLPSDYVKWQQYGGKRIKFTLDEVKSLPKVYEPGIQLLGFKPLSCIKPYLYIKPSNFIYPNENDIHGSNKLFTALLERCLGRKVAAIARVVPRKSASVAWAALIPQAEQLDEKNCQLSPPGFHVSYLPFADDFRNIEIENRTRASEPQVDAAKEMIKKMHFKYHPECFENPDIQTHWRNVEALALNRSSLEPVIDYTVPNYDRMEKKAGNLISTFKDLVYESSYDPSQVIKKRPAPASSAGAVKKVKVDAGPISVEEMAKNKKVDKLTIGVLKAWLTDKDVRVTGKKKPQLVQDVYDQLDME